jgi:branched-subunit amino acid transport protein AzlD
LIWPDLCSVEEQIEIIKEEAIFSRLDILPFAILANHLLLRTLFGDLFCEVYVPAWHWCLRQVNLSIALGTCF